MTAYYNEIEPFAAQWLRNLIHAGHIAPGIVDERSIEDVHPSDLKGFTQCHFFAGIGVWSYALRRAGWTDDRPVWTGSCPCQPFSAAGQGAGFADERHLWPAFFHLISECRPTAVFGEQVASKDSGPWIDLVHADLETMGYAFGAVPFPSASVGAPHIRDRLYWVANAESPRSPHRGSGAVFTKFAEGGRELGILANAPDQRWDRRRASGASHGRDAARVELERLRNAGDLADAVKSERGRRPDDGALLRNGQAARRVEVSSDAERSSGLGLMGDTEREGLALGQRVAGVLGGASGADQGQASERAGAHAGGLADAYCGLDKPSSPWADQRAVAGSDGALQAQHEPAGPVNGFWRDADWIFCRDGRWRPVEPGTQPLVTGAPSRVGRLRAYGNAINAEAARVFIEATMTEAA